MSNERSSKTIDDIINNLKAAVGAIDNERFVSDTSSGDNAPSLNQDMMKVFNEDMEQFILFSYNTKKSSYNFLSTRAYIFNSLISRAHRSDTAMLFISMMIITHIDEIIDNITVKNTNNDYGPNERSILCENLRAFLGDKSVWNLTRELIELGDGIAKEYIDENGNGKKE